MYIHDDKYPTGQDSNLKYLLFEFWATTGPNKPI